LPNTEGEIKTLEYVSKHFKEVSKSVFYFSLCKAGLTPGNLKNNSFFHEVPLVNLTHSIVNDEVR
jgi:hypothetical protein